jgi:hypothetical protein
MRTEREIIEDIETYEEAKKSVSEWDVLAHVTFAVRICALQWVLSEAPFVHVPRLYSLLQEPSVFEDIRAETQDQWWGARGV